MIQSPLQVFLPEKWALQLQTSENSLQCNKWAQICTQPCQDGTIFNVSKSSSENEGHAFIYVILKWILLW
jgi:hypothetical protein